MKLPVYADVARAGERLAGVAVRTPLLQNATLDALTGGRILLKPECLQRVGAFKLRGAYNRIADVDREAFPGGVVACSSGNHAQGVAAAAALLGQRAAVVMPRSFCTIASARTETPSPARSGRNGAPTSSIRSTMPASSPGRVRSGSRSSPTPARLAPHSTPCWCRVRAAASRRVSRWPRNMTIRV